MPSDRHITWDNFNVNFIQPGDPAAHVVDGTPSCHLFVEADGSRTGLRVAVSDPTEVVELPFQHIETNLVHSGEGLCAEISCDTRSLYEPFYAMLVSVVDLVQRHSYKVSDALNESAQKFFSLLSEHSILSEEKQIGLWCELWVLDKLLRFRGTDSIKSWIGSLDEPHDFRFDSVEVEVKGTRSRRRSHLISSEDQLLPSADSDLYLFSLQLARGSGDNVYSLPDRVRKVHDRLCDAPGPLSVFESLLDEAKYNSSHEHFYRDQYKLRSRPTLVPVTDEIPRITMDVLKSALGPEKTNRLSEIKFRLDVTDLGFEESDDSFQSVIRTR